MRQVISGSLGRSSVSSARDDALNLRFWIVPSHWGRGLATDAARVAVGVAFEELAASEVWAGAATWNDASHVVPGKLMVHREHRDRGFQTAGRWVPNERYSLSAEQWGVCRGVGDDDGACRSRRWDGARRSR